MIGRERGGAAPEGELTEALIGRRLDAMPALPRTVFLLHHMDGLDVAAIGAQLGLGIEAIDEQLRQAMRMLVFGEDEG